MKIIINEEYIKKVIDAYERLGFNIADDAIYDVDSDYRDIIVSFVGLNNIVNKKKLNKINLEDLNAAYMISNSVNDSERDVILNNIAFKTLFDYIKDDSVKNKVNKKLFNYLLDNYDEIDEEKDKNENNIKNDEENFVEEEEIPIKVEKVSESKELSSKAGKKINSESVAIIAGIIILGSSIAFASQNYSKSNKTEVTTEDNDVNNEIEIQTPVMTQIQTSNEAEINNEVSENIAETEEETEETIDVHSDEFINNVTDKIINNIQLDQNIAYKYDRDLVEALVRYTHHNYDEYTGSNTLSNELAYEDLSELIRHGFDISMFYEGLNNCENLRALYNSTKDLKQEKGKYEDEFKIYMCMDVVMNEMNTNNFAEAVALRAYVDNYSVIPSMQMARQQAGVLEMKDTQDLWRDVNKDGKTTYEENAEGKGYNDEKAAAMAVRYGEMSSETCKNIYNRISTDDRNSELSVIVYRALDEDDARARTR